MNSRTRSSENMDHKHTDIKRRAKFHEILLISFELSHSQVVCAHGATRPKQIYLRTASGDIINAVFAVTYSNVIP